MLFSYAPTVIYLKRNSLEVYTPKAQGAQAKLEFPPNYEKDQEIKDIENFEQLITNFLSKLNLKNKKVIVVLSQENLFEKTIPLSDKTKEEAAAKKFFDEVPFDTQKVAKKQVRTKNGLNLIAANKNLYESIVHVLQKLQAEIRAVVPTTMFGVTSSTLTKEDVKKITSNSQMLKTSNFLTIVLEVKNENEETSQQKETGDDKPKANKLILGVSALIVIGIAVALFLLYKQGYFNRYLKSEEEASTQTSAQQSTLPEANIENLESTNQAQLSPKNSITIQVLNGSGIAGQATQVQNVLESLSYSQIEVGNSQTQDLTTTTITYSESVNNSYVEEIKAELEKTFTNVKTEKAKGSQNFDIIITTGQPG